MWVCPRCGYFIVTKRLSDAFDKAQLHIVYSHKSGFEAKRINRFTIWLGEFGVIQRINDRLAYELYNNPATHGELIRFMRESGFLKSKI